MMNRPGRPEMQDAGGMGRRHGGGEGKGPRGRGERHGEPSRDGKGRGGPEGRGERGGRGRGGRKRLFDYGELRHLVLMLIAEQPRHGYELIKQIEERSEGTYTPSPGVIYPTLSWLEDMGYARIVPDEGGRKRATITEEGQAFLAANQRASEELMTRKQPYSRAHAPKAVVEAMDQLKSALTSRFTAGEIDEVEIAQIAGHIHALATQIAGDVKSDAQPGQPSAPARSGEGRGSNSPVITRHRHEAKRRTLNVKEISRLTPHMVRAVLEGEELSDFISLGADDHVKLFFTDETGAQQMRDYTPRYYDTEARTLTLDFAVHEAGPATEWALEAKVGDSLTIGGPRGSGVIAPIFDWYLLIGDETALPAIGRKTEELGEGVKVLTLAGIPGPEDEQRFESAADVTQTWVHRPVSAAADPEPMLEAARGLTLPEGKGFIWIAAEAQVARALRDHFAERGHPREWTKASGYWAYGTSEKGAKKID